MSFDESEVARDQGGRFAEKAGTAPEVSLTASVSGTKPRTAAKVTCQQCEERVPRDQTAIAQRKGGGSYRRAARYYSSVICLSCATSLLQNASPGFLTSSRWSVTSLRLAVERINRAHTTAYTQP